MSIWLRRHTPTWLLRYLVWRNYRLRMAGRLPDDWYWADMELCIRQKQVCDKCGRLPVLLDFEHECNPVGVPKWLGEEHKPFGSIASKGVLFIPCLVSVITVLGKIVSSVTLHMVQNRVLIDIVETVVLKDVLKE